MSVEQVARERGLTKSTIVGHLERLLQAGQDIDLRSLLSPERFEEIRRACPNREGNTRALLDVRARNVEFLTPRAEVQAFTPGPDQGEEEEDIPV